MEPQSDKWKTAFFVLLVIILAIGIAVGAYLFGSNQLAKRDEVSTLDPELISPAPQFAVPTSTPTPTVDEGALIKQSVFAETELSSDEAEVTISEIRGNHAKGGIKEFDAVGGAYWIAAKTTQGWVTVYHGQATPDCSDIELYGFPSDMVPQCLDDSDNVIDR